MFAVLDKFAKKRAKIQGTSERRERRAGNKTTMHQDRKGVLQARCGQSQDIFGAAHSDVPSGVIVSLLEGKS